MKLEALDHPKTMEFAAQLGVELPAAIGHLELLWAFAGKKTPRGDIGKWSDAVIASACYWRGSPSDFVQALVTARFVDDDPEYRLVVHDWPEHCPNWVRAKLKRDGVEFARLKLGLKTDTNDDSNAGTSRADLNQAKRSEEKPSRADALVLHESLPKDTWQDWLDHRQQKRWPNDDRTLRRQLALLAQYPAEVQRQIIDTSINAGWQGLFAPKDSKRATPAADLRTAAINRIKQHAANIQCPLVPRETEPAEAYESRVKDWERDNCRATGVAKFNVGSLAAAKTVRQ